MTTPPTPTYPYCVTITKPGYDTVHLGFTHASQAETASATLKGSLHYTAHPAGTTIDWGATPDGVAPEPPIATDLVFLAEEIDKMASGDGTGSAFPDLYSRLCAQEGYDAGKIWLDACRLLDEQPETLPEDTDDQPTAEDPKQGVTAGYDLEQDTWHVEIHRAGQPVEIIRIVAPQTADEETARTLAEQVAENLGYRHIENNTGLTPPENLIAQIRAAAWLPVEDDPSLIAEISRLRAFMETADQLGWTRCGEPRVAGQISDGVVYDANGVQVIAGPGLVVADATGPITPEMARAVGATLVTAAKQAEALKSAELHAARNTTRPA